MSAPPPAPAPAPPPPPGAGLSHERIVLAALKLADESGIDKLTMRSLAKDLAVTPMSLYRYFENKEALLDHMIDEVFAKIDVPTVGNSWRSEMHQHAHSVRRALLEHTWALRLIETRSNPGPATLAHHDAVIGTLAAGGFTMELVAQAFSLLDAFVYGFVLQEITLPLYPGDEDSAAVQASLASAPPGDAYPHLMALATEHLALPGYRFGDQFDFGLDLLLDGLASRSA